MATIRITDDKWLEAYLFPGDCGRRAAPVGAAQLSPVPNFLN
jgi:hypothetical protein